MKKCKVCKSEFVQFNTLQVICVECAIEKGKKKTAKDVKTALQTKKRELIRDKEAIKTRAQWLKEAQQAFNAFIRSRDKEQPCISCQRHHEGQWHAGHYRTTSAAPELRFNEHNVHKQCAPCNNHKHGNITEYRINLIKKIGINEVEWLESAAPPKKYTISELKEIKDLYKQKIKDLQNS